MACRQEKKKRVSLFSKGKTDSSSTDVKGIQKKGASSSFEGIQKVSCRCDRESEYKKYGTRSVITGAQQSLDKRGNNLSQIFETSQNLSSKGTDFASLAEKLSQKK